MRTKSRTALSQAAQPRSPEELQAHICSVVGALHTSLKALMLNLWREIGSMRSDLRPGDLSAALRLDKTLAGRILRALRQRDPLTTAFHLPGTDGLRMLCKSAASKIGAESVAPVWDAVARYEEMVEDDVGGHSALQTLISGWLPEARRKDEQVGKQHIFKGMSLLFGFQMDVSVMAFCVQPGSKPGRADTVTIHGVRGIRRLRDGVSLPPLGYLTSRMDRATVPGEAVQTLAGEQLGRGMGPVLLTDYCSGPMPDFEATETKGDRREYVHQGNHLGSGSAISYYIAERHPNEAALYRSEASNLEILAAGMGSPAKVLQFDMFIRDDVWCGVEPGLSIYWTGRRGPVMDEELEARRRDRLDLHEMLARLGHGITRIHSSDVDNYAAMMRDVFAMLGWPGERFRGYRCRIQYPVVGTQIIVAFNLPRAPAEE